MTRAEWCALIPSKGFAAWALASVLVAGLAIYAPVWLAAVAGRVALWGLAVALFIVACLVQSEKDFP